MPVQRRMGLHALALSRDQPTAIRAVDRNTSGVLRNGRASVKQR